MKITIKTILSAIVLTGSLLIFQGCDKNDIERDYPTPAPIEQTITQSFGMQISSQVTPITKGWTKDTWVTNYNQTPTVLTLTGTGASAGRTYTKTCTIAELKAGTVQMTILPGSYKATYTTPHTQSLNNFSLNGNSLSSLFSTVGDVLDIKIDQNLTCTGTPLTLTALLDDYLIIVDIPSETSVQVYNNTYYAGATSGNGFPLLMNSFYSTAGFHYGYHNDLNNFKAMPSGKVISGTSFVKGNAYHVISAFQASTVLNIPDFIQNEVILP